MSDGTDDRLLVGFQQWQLGVVLVAVVAAAGSLATIALGWLGVPYGEGIGFVGGVVSAFLAVSFWGYGR